MKICIDPGHGGADPGAVNGNRYEKDDVLRLALAVKPLLEAQGVEVVMTRETDKSISIAERCALANKAGCNYFLSIHRDAASPTAYGISAWVHSRANAATVAKAQAVLDAVLAVTPTHNRRVNKGSANPAWTDYGVNVQSNAASCLLEVGFITNDADNKRFDDYFDDYAQAITRGLCSALGVTYNDAPAQTKPDAETPQEQPTAPQEAQYIYRVYEQVGAFSNAENAQRFAAERGNKTIIQMEIK